MRINRFDTLKVLAVLLYFSACKDYKPEMEQALMERDSVMLVSQAKDSSLNSFIETLNEIELNLDSITQAQDAISMDTKNTIEFSQDIRDRISNNIMLIGNLLQDNQEKISNLETQLRNSNINLASLRKSVERLSADVTAKDAEISSLSAQLVAMKLLADSLYDSVDSLNLQNSGQNELIAQKTMQLNTAYYVIGSYKDLRDRNVISSEGGFLGIGKGKILKQDFNSDTFMRIDITKVTEFVLNDKEVKLITNHPSDSYSLQKDNDIITSLKVTDPTKFWGASKYLVIVTG